jgi:threonine aldolase
MLYSKKEIEDILAVCRRYDLFLYVDGARLGYGLTSSQSDITLPWLAKHVDVFYIGGTKVGAMFGEAVVFTNTKAPRAFFTTIKRHGALLAKGRMLGLQFNCLFTDNLYFRVARHANEMAMRLRNIFLAHGKQMGVDSPTNQQFVVLTPSEKEQLMQTIAFEVWSPMADGNILCRFVTSWATTDEDMETLDKALSALS